MKMINAGNAELTDYSKYIYNCIRTKCQSPYPVPLPDISGLQLFVNFGTKKPTEYVFTLIDRCTYGQTMEVQPNCHIIAHTGQYWYGVFNDFSQTTYEAFVVSMEVTFEDNSKVRYFSEQYIVPPACGPLTMVSVCYPRNYNSEDPNGVYVGEPSEDYPISGSMDVRYQHKYWVQGGEVVEVQNKITFNSNSKRNFTSTLNKIFEFRTELVPGFYKNYLLAVYFRGNFYINNTETKASELLFENVLEDADLWKPYVKLDKEIKGAFGCAPTECLENCTSICELDISDIHVTHVTSSGFSVSVSGLLNTANGDSCSDSWDIQIREKGGVVVAEQTGLGPAEVYDFTEGFPNSDYTIVVVKHCCQNGLTSTQTLPQTLPAVDPIPISGSIAYTCVDPPGSQGYVVVTFNFDAPLPVNTTFQFGSVISWPPDKYGHNLAGFVLPPGITPVGAQDNFIKTFPAGTTSLVVNGLDLPTTNPGRTGWTCNDDGSYHTSDIFIKCTTPGYYSDMRSGTTGIVVHNQ